MFSAKSLKPLLTNIFFKRRRRRMVISNLPTEKHSVFLGIVFEGMMYSVYMLFLPCVSVFRLVGKSGRDQVSVFTEKPSLPHHTCNLR